MRITGLVLMILVFTTISLGHVESSKTYYFKNNQTMICKNEEDADIAGLLYNTYDTDLISYYTKHSTCRQVSLYGCPVKILEREGETIKVRLRGTLIKGWVDVEELTMKKPKKTKELQ